MEVAGLGAYRRTYAGNLEITTAAAAGTAERLATEILAGRYQLKAVKEAA